MCFGSKKEVGDEPPAHPVQRPPSVDQSSVKKSKYNPQYTPPGQSSLGGGSNAAPSGGAPHSKLQDDYAAPPGPPPGQNNGFVPPSGPPPTQRHNDYAPPSGPPPGHGGDYAPPSGPPPSHQQGGDYAPPSGPPPAASDDWAAPPPGPPPAQGKPEHDWEAAVPDTSLFPPPPAIFSGFDRSPASNAPEEEAIAGEDWCQKYPLTRPMVLDRPGLAALQASNFRLMEPVGFNGKLNWLSPGRWSGHTARNTPDRCIIAYPPLYSVNEHDPIRLGQPKTIYYELKLHANSPHVSVGMGFTALPYPSFRMPGWHRGSLAVHGDDGHKYINDRWGGKTFTDEFRRGETYGIGMTFKPVGGAQPQIDVFFTRNGTLTGGWPLHEETDADQDLPVTGLEGFHDLSCAIGTYDGVSFEVIFDPTNWLYKPF